MKKLLKNLSLVMLIPLVYFICATGFNDFKEAGKYTNTTTTPAYTFTNTIFNTGFNVMAYFPWLILTKNLEQYNELNFNAVHWYDWEGSDNYGKIYEPLTPNQKDNFIHAIDSVNEKGLLGFYERSFISNYCYGQRLIYEVKPYNDNSSVNYGFVYEQCMENTYTMDGDRTVLHANPSVNTEGYLCKNIYENLQHTDLFGFRLGDKGKWFLKPVMKISSNTPPNTNVVRIDIMAFDNPDDNNIQIPVRSITITADNFLNKGVYNSDYLGLNPELATYGDYYDENEPYLSLGMTGVEWWNWDDKCHIDFRVYWYGECDVWFDQMIVDDSRANEMFDPQYQGRINTRIKLETNSFANIPGNYCFFVDEVTNANISCMRYVFQQMREAVPNVKISMATTDNMHILSLKNDDLPYTVFIDSLHPTFIQHDVHKFEVWEGNLTTSSYALVLPNTIPINECDPMIPSDFFKPVEEYNSHLQSDALGYKHKEVLNNQQGSLIYEIYKVYDSKPVGITDIKFIIQPQIQGLLTKKSADQYYLGGAREPTNEEIQVQAMISIAHGASGLCWYIYGSEIYNYNSNQRTINGVDAIFPDEAKYNTTLYTYGLLDQSGIKRHHNCYNQDKWNYVSQMNGKIINWTNVLNNADWVDGFSVHQEGANNHYISDIKSKVPLLTGENPCQSSYPMIGYFDCVDERYWEQGFYNPKDQSDKSKYLLMVNRRCVPPSQSGIGDARILFIRFDPNAEELSISNNWILKDVITGQQITFDKNNQGISGYLNLGETTNDIGYFQPGEGKLFQLIPVSSIGGTLVADETLSGNVNCNGIIHNGGHNVTISPGATISFLDTAGIEMNGGTFTCGANADVSPVNLVGKDDSHTWKGLVLSNCSSIAIYKTNISKIHANDTAKAVLISNCYNINIGKSTFNMGSNAGAIQAVFTENTDEPSTFNVSECNFYMGSSSYSAISISSSASNTLPVIFDWCNFNTTNENSNAILLYGVTGGAVKNSVFTNYISTINTLTSTIDLYNNTILGGNNSTGILCVNGSSISLSPTSGQYFGGNNYIRNYGGSSSNIYSDNSYFNINNGGNNFDLDNIDNSKHFTGTMSGMPYSYVNAMKNCFHKDSITNIEALHSVIWNSSSDPVNLLFTPYICELTVPNDYFVYQYSGYNDTVYYRAGGEGSGFNPNKPMNIEENVYKSLKDSINANLRKRNYLTVEDKAKQLLTQYPDSLESAYMVQKLYMASLSLDSTKIGITKTFLENLIAANTQNPTLIKRAFYFIQKCKVKLGQYQSALDGFQYIMTQNPYTYEGLVASWDYAATYLLMGTGGSYKGDYEEQTEELFTPADTLLNRMTKRDINTNKGVNSSTTEQVTKTFYEKIKNVTKDDKTAQEEKVKTLEKKIETSKSKNEKNDAETELAKLKQIKEVVKLKKPNTVMTHTAIINSDIKKVFGIGKKSSKETTNNLIPQTYALYQNYPNPFNPTTKIAYDIPTNAKVKLVIYDILGREMKTLVNNEFRSGGKYITEFNGSNLASGIYFARILVNDGKDFMAVKKMVLVK